MFNGENMKIVCPYCEAKNNIKKEHAIHCGSCSQAFPDELYAQEKFFKRINLSKKTKSTVIAGLVGAGAVMGYKVENALDDNRYPLRTEYQIIASCSNSSYSPRIVEQCICALEETLKSVSYDEIDTKFRSQFQANLRLRKCSR